MSYRAEVAGSPVEVVIDEVGLRAGSHVLAHEDLDGIEVAGWTVHLRGPHGVVSLERLGRDRDDLLRELRRHRLPARRAALLQSGTAAPVASYEAHHAGRDVLVTLHRDGLTVEGDHGPTVFLPLSLVTDVVRDGYQLTLHARALPPLEIGRLGRVTDRFLADLDRTRRELADRTAAAYAALDPALAVLPAPDGWAVTRADAGGCWPPLRAAFAASGRAREVAVLEELTGPALRLGIKAAFADTTLPFVLAPVGDRVVVEGAGEQARATFVFATTDVDQVNVALLLTSFRRDALALPEHELGRWAVAVRMLEVVRWARAVLSARVVHDAAWERNLRAAVTGAS